MLDDVNYQILNTEDNPSTKAKNPSQIHSGGFHLEDGDPHQQGKIIKVTSMLTDNDKNLYMRYEDILIKYEQEKYPLIDDNIYSKFIYNSIKRHGQDLQIPENNVDIPSLEQLLKHLRTA